MGAATKEDDFIEHVFVAATHDYLMLFTDRGRCYWLKVFEIPEGGRASRGKSIANLISKEAEEKITSYVTVKKFEDPFFVLMVTEQGMIKKTPLGEFSSPRRTGIGAITLAKGDRLMDVRLTDGTQDIVLGTREGMAIRFHEGEVRPMGRTASGVRAIRLGKGDRVIGSVALRRTGTTILVATERGFGKRSETGEYRVTRRSGKGIITVKTTEKTGKMVAIKEVVETDDVVIVTTGGIVIRQHASEIRLAGRNTQGVRLIRLGENDAISDVAAVVSEEEEAGVPAAAPALENGQSELFPKDGKNDGADGKTNGAASGASNGKRRKAEEPSAQGGAAKPESAAPRPAAGEAKAPAAGKKPAGGEKKPAKAPKKKKK